MLEEEKMKVVELNMRDYENRNGYDSKFLDKEISIPIIPNNMVNDIVKLKNSDESELKYTNFSVVMSKSRGLAFFTVVNINGSELEELARRGDAWYYDPRIE